MFFSIFALNKLKRDEQENMDSRLPANGAVTNDRINL
jgi:hypothetical protein